MRTSPLGPLYDMDEQAPSVGMDVDDPDAMDVLESFMDRHPVDAEFFNSFEDDFDDADIN